MTLPSEIPVAIVGGGTCGLTLACLLTRRGVPCVVLERRTAPRTHSRAIGIHPPALHVLQAVGVAEELIRRGVKIGNGLVYLDDKQIGHISLSHVDATFPFVLSVPQTVTEAVLEARLHELAPGILLRGASVSHTEQKDDATYLCVETASGTARLRARYVVACDGKNSTLRQEAAIPFPGGTYPDAYLMGDFADNTPFGTDAALFVTNGGIVESFPLPGGMRRWVARLPERTTTTDARDLAAIVRERTGFAPPVDTCVWMSPFGIEYRLARTLTRGNLLLAGDAAHIVSPIGGQGMNLGFGDAAALARLLTDALAGTGTRHRYHDARTKVARIALRRAEWNTVLGRPCPAWHPHRALVWGMANVPTLRNHFAGVFTMQGLEADVRPF